MHRHAYLIMAYNNPDQLLKLIGLLDDCRNDIYVHIDAEADFPMDRLKGAAHKAGLVVTERVPVRWADYSQMKAEFVLLETARNSGTRYSYYHLLSGMDLPIKTQDEIHRFFDGQTDEFIGIVSRESQYNRNHVRYLYPLLRTKLYRKYKLVRCFNVAFVLLQKLLGVDVQKKRNTEGWAFYDGWTWFSITEDFVEYVLSKKDLVDTVFCNSKASDEKVLQTLAYNSDFRDRLHDMKNLKKGSMRYIDWKRGTPYVFRSSDFDELMASPCMFARKFDERVDSDIIDKIYAHLLREGKSCAEI